MNNINTLNMQEPEEQHAVITLAPLTNDLSSSYVIKFDQEDNVSFWGVQSIESAFECILESEFSTATIHFKNEIPNIDL